MSRFSQFTGGSSGSVPTGTLIQTLNLSSPPEGYLPTKGCCYCSADYPDLYAILGAPSPDETFNQTIDYNSALSCAASAYCILCDCICALRVVKHCGCYKLVLFGRCCTSSEKWAAMAIDGNMCVTNFLPLCFPYGSSYNYLYTVGVTCDGKLAGHTALGGWGSGGSGIRWHRFTLDDCCINTANCSTSEPYYNYFCLCNFSELPVNYVARTDTYTNICSIKLQKYCFTGHTASEIANTCICKSCSCTQAIMAAYYKDCYVPAAVGWLTNYCCCGCANNSCAHIVIPSVCETCAVVTTGLCSFFVKPFFCYCLACVNNSYDTTSCWQTVADPDNNLVCQLNLLYGVTHLCFGKSGSAYKRNYSSTRLYTLKINTSTGSVTSASNTDIECCFDVSDATRTTINKICTSNLLDKAYAEFITIPNDIMYYVYCCCHCCAVWCCSTSTSIYSSGSAGTKWAAKTGWTASELVTNFCDYTMAPNQTPYDGTTLYGAGTVPEGTMLVPSLSTGVSGVCYYVKT